jgi:hypothetical protein
MLTYKQRLDADFDWALREGSLHFENASLVHETLRKLVARLDDLDIPYAVLGDMAMFFHGYRRYTEIVELLLTADGLNAFHRHIDRLGYIRPSERNWNLLDSETGVLIKFVTAGQRPANNESSPLAYPAPGPDDVTIDGMRFLALPRLIELKLASGMTHPRLLRELADVQQMIEKIGLPESVCDELHPCVRDRYREFWTMMRDNPPEE